jgi:hypothetical protein
VGQVFVYLGSEDRNVEPGVALDERVEGPDNPFDSAVERPLLLMQLLNDLKLQRFFG